MRYRAFPAATVDTFRNSDMRPIGSLMLGCIAPPAREMLDHAIDKWTEGLRAQGIDAEENRADAEEFLSWFIRKSGLLDVPEAQWDEFETLVLGHRAEFIRRRKDAGRLTAYSMAYWFIRWSGLIEVKEAS